LFYTTTKQEAIEAAINAAKETDLIDLTDQDQKPPRRGALLSHITQRLAYKGVRERKMSKEKNIQARQRTGTVRNVNRIQAELKDQYLWRSLSPMNCLLFGDLF
jgi:hypothetical protein